MRAVPLRIPGALRALPIAAALMLVGCPTTISPNTDAGPMDAGGEPDTGPPGVDSGPPEVDAGPLDDDAGPDVDAGTLDEDAGSPTDAGMDSGPVLDAGPDDCMDAPEDPDRPTAVVCSPCRPPGIAPGTGGGGGGPGDCADDSDCTDGDNGRCSWMRFGRACTYDQCFEDSDCGTDEVCRCNGGRSGQNVCQASDCTTNADCGAYECTETLGSCGNYSPPVGYYCHGPGDECQSDQDCMDIDAGPFIGPGTPSCRYLSNGDGTRSWQCSSLECVG